MYGISGEGKTDWFVGRNVSPEKIEEVKGRNLSDQELESNKNSMVRDNFVCTECESLFGVVESPFSSTLSAIRTGRVLTLDSGIEIRLFFIIQAWRASVCRYNDWELPEEFEENLRVIILNACRQFGTGISPVIERQLKSIPIIITHLETAQEEESNNVIVLTNNQNPYFLFVCDFVLQLFEPTDSVQGVSPPQFFDLNGSIEHKPINHLETQFRIGFMQNSDRRCLVKNIMDNIAAPEAFNGFIARFVSFCTSSGISVNDKMIGLYINALVHEPGVADGDRYSDQRIEQIFSRFLKKQ